MQRSRPKRKPHNQPDQIELKILQAAAAGPVWLALAKVSEFGFTTIQWLKRSSRIDKDSVARRRPTSEPDLPGQTYWTMSAHLLAGLDKGTSGSFTFNNCFWLCTCASSSFFATASIRLEFRLLFCIPAGSAQLTKQVQTQVLAPSPLRLNSQFAFQKGNLFVEPMLFVQNLSQQEAAALRLSRQVRIIDVRCSGKGTQKFLGGRKFTERQVGSRQLVG
jgi:hypothetical protein